MTKLGRESLSSELCEQPGLLGLRTALCYATCALALMHNSSCKQSWLDHVFHIQLVWGLLRLTPVNQEQNAKSACLNYESHLMDERLETMTATYTHTCT